MAELQARISRLEIVCHAFALPWFSSLPERPAMETRKRELAGENEAVLDLTQPANWYTKNVKFEKQVPPPFSACAPTIRLTSGSCERALDPVAAFHLGNGAAV